MMTAGLEAELIARRAVVAQANAPEDDTKEEVFMKPTPTMPADWATYHSTDCGTKYRGCAPDCPKDIWERTGVWTGAHQATCPTCGQPMPGGVPAQPAMPPTYDASGDRGVVLPAPAPDANIANEPPPSGYMSRKKML